MPETVWDYVAKLKTSVTKASSRYSIYFYVFYNAIENQYFTSLFVFFFAY